MFKTTIICWSYEYFRPVELDNSTFIGGTRLYLKHSLKISLLVPTSMQSLDLTLRVLAADCPLFSRFLPFRLLTEVLENIWGFPQFEYVASPFRGKTCMHIFYAHKGYAPYITFRSTNSTWLFLSKIIVLQILLCNIISDGTGLYLECDQIC
jgi:hypothetical protein